MLVLRSLLFAIGQWLSTLIWAPVVLLSFPVPYRQRYWVITRWARFNLWWLRLSCGIRWQVEGRENIPDRATVVLSKHQSAWETLALQLLFQPSAWVLKRELLWIPFFGWGLALMRPIAIDRSAGRESMKRIVDQGRERLGNGIWVVIFPEGTRIAPGKRGRYRTGGAVLACETDHPVLPVAHNAGEFWPRNSFLKRPGVIRIVIGSPIDSNGKTPAELNAEVEAWIETRMAGISATPAEALS